MICWNVRVFAAAGRLLAALLLAGVVVVVGGVPAHACSCKAGSTPDDAKAASDVFTGTVEDATTSGGPRRDRVVTYDVTVDRVYKGDVRTEDVTVTSPATAGQCGVGDLRADRRYLFFARGAAGAELSTGSCSGTAPARGVLVARVERLLGDGRDPAPPAPPETASFTTVADGRPASVTRLAAPGAALVLVGLLGLVVVRRLAGRS